MITAIATVRRRAFLLAGAAALAAAAPSLAQENAPGTPTLTDVPSPQAAAETEETPKDIVVTGTRIRGIAPVGAAVVQLDQQAIRDTGIQSTTDVLKSVPQIANIGSDVGRTGSNANGQAFNIAQSSGINLRGLGTQATLTLVDGRRPAPGGSLANLFDPSAIPTIALSNIEVLADGASALYGSDAIAGVVNLGIRKNFDGVEVQGRYNFADGTSGYRLSGIVGHKFDHGHVMIAGEYEVDGSLRADARPNLFIGAGTPITQIAAAAPVPNGYSNQTPLPNFTLAGVPYAENANGTVTAGVKNIFSKWTGANYLPLTRRLSFVAAADTQVSDTITLYAEGFYSKRKYDELTLRGSAGGAGQSANINVPATNPYLQQFFTANGLTPANIVANYAFLNSLGPTLQNGFEENWMTTGGVKVDLPHDFKGDLSFSYGSNVEHRYQTGLLDNNGLVTALNSTNTATAFNPFGPTPAAVLTTINAINNQTTGYDLKILAAKADGSLFRLPAGEVKIAVGAEYDWNNEHIYNFATTRSVPDATGAPFFQDTARKMDVYSGYGEIVIPVFGADNRTFAFHRLDLTAAVRYDHYNVKPCYVNTAILNPTGVPCASTTPQFDTVNPKAGFTWKPIDDLTVRGSYGTSFRYNLLVADANGAPLYSGTTTYADAVFGNNTVAVLRGGGFPELKPETARTWTAGLEYKPEWAHGIDITATYFNVHYNNIIEGPTAIQNGNTAATSALYAPYIVRRPSLITPGADDTAFNALVASVIGSSFYTSFAAVPNTPAGIASVKEYIEQRNQNLGAIETDGVDFTATYRFDIGQTNWVAGVTGTKYFNYKRSFAPGQVPVQVYDLIDFPTSYRLRGQLALGWKPLRANLFVNYTPSYVNTYDASGGIPVSVGGFGTRVAPQATLDLSATLDIGRMYKYRIAQGLTIGVDVINLFDKTPAFARVGAPIVQNFDSSTASAVMRSVSFRIGKTF